MQDGLRGGGEYPSLLPASRSIPAARPEVPDCPLGQELSSASCYFYRAGQSRLAATREARPAGVNWNDTIGRLVVFPLINS